MVGYLRGLFVSVCLCVFHAVVVHINSFITRCNCLRGTTRSGVIRSNITVSTYHCTCMHVQQRHVGCTVT